MAANPKPRHVRLCLNEISPSPENATLYRPVDPGDDEIKLLAQSIREHGLREPIVVTKDRYILSGHRRYAAAWLAGLYHIDCRVEPIRRADDIDRFVLLLREHNRQRDKTGSEMLREELVTANPEEAYQALTEHRNAANCRPINNKIVIRGEKSRDPRFWRFDL